MAEPGETRLYELVAQVARAPDGAPTGEESNALMPCFVFARGAQEAGERVIAELRRLGLHWGNFAPRAVIVPVEQWSAHVAANWAEVADLLPSQEQVEAMDREQGIFFGPAAGFVPTQGGAGA